jgi:hypothetical protein
VYTDGNQSKAIVIFLAVALTHLGLLYWAVQSKYFAGRGPSGSSTLFVLINIPPEGRPPVQIPPLTTSMLQSDLRELSAIRLGSPFVVPPSILSPPSQGAPPDIDWDRELHLAVSSVMSNDERERAYRDLSGLTPAQRKWLIDNQYQPVKPGVSWKPRRVEMAEGGFPIIHLGDRCIAVPMLMMMVFCKF